MANTFRELGPGEDPRLSSALARLDALVDWERRDRAPGGRREMRVDLEPARDLVARLGSPERRLRCVHVAGSKGKGSVSALIAAGLARAGLATGIYASPHVERIHERITVRGRAVRDLELARALERALAAREAALRAESAAARATWFDVLTAAAFLVFAEAELDLAVIECGLGGRLDSTNVVRPEVCVLTNVLLEHTAILGSTRAAIAAEKAGILKPGASLVHAVGGPEDEAGAVVAAAAEALGIAPVRVTHAPGAALEEQNVALAEAVLDELGRRGVAGAAGPVGARDLDAAARVGARLAGRMERFREGTTPIVLDGAHVAESLEALLADAARDPELAGPPVVVLGLGKDKDAPRLLKVLHGRVDRVLCTSSGAGPYRDAGELLVEARRAGLVAETAPTPGAALEHALRSVAPNGWVLVTGSLHLVGAVRGRVRGRSESPAC